MLTAASAPRKATTLADDVVLMTATLWHGWAHQALVNTGLPFMQEVKLAKYMPKGWTGTADWVIWNPELKGFVLSDMKTINGNGIAWIEKDGLPYSRAVVEEGAEDVERRSGSEWACLPVDRESDASDK